MSGSDPNLQYHLAVDASQEAVGGCLFQLHGAKPGTEATLRFQLNERIIMFLSFRLNNAETRYSNSEREYLAVVRCLAEVKWLVMDNKYPVILYSDHEALKPIFATGQTEKGRIATWIDRLGEYDYKLVHRPSRDQHIGIADGLSRMPTRLTSKSMHTEEGRMAMAAVEQLTGPLRMFEDMPSRFAKYEESPMYQDIIKYMQGGEEALEEMQLTRNRKRYLRFIAKSYRLPEAHKVPILKYYKSTGAESPCLIEAEIPRFLNAAHKDHGHYTAALTLNFLIGRAFWSTQIQNINK